MYFNNFKKAFTLAEVLITLLILGIIAALTLPAVLNTIPSKEDSMHKKISYIIEEVVGQIYDDEVMYPPKSDLFAQGFQNTQKSVVNGIDYEGNEKFCRLFASKFNKLSNDVVCENELEETETLYAEGKKSFTSTDNVDWYLPVTNFRKGSARIMVDVNGSNPPNCIEGSSKCKRPDRFIYYIKSNGTVTYTTPEEGIKDKFKITVNVTTEGCNDPATCGEENIGGTHSIAKLNSNGSEGTYSSSAAKYKDLERNTKYVLKATPKDGFFTDWPLDKKRVIIFNSDVTVNLKFHKRPKYCITMDIANCDDDDIKNCGTYSLEKNCAYREVTNKTGEYKLNNDGAFEYVGLGVDGGKYKYDCPSTDTITLSSGLKVGHPEIDPATGKVVRNAAGEAQFDDSYKAVSNCDLYTGDYRLNVIPKTGYQILPNDKYIQDVKLGTDNLTFTVSLRKQ